MKCVSSTRWFNLDAAEHPHAVAAFGSNTMTYDKNGNMTYASGPDVASSYAFDPENRMAISRSGAFIKTYLYDGMGELVRRSRWHVWYAPGTNDMRDTFVDGIYEEQNGPTTPFVATTQTSCSPPAKITKYYTAFGRVIATRVNGVLSYNLADHLGSTVQQIDSTNTPGPAIKYFPFGAPRNGTTSPERAFTGQQREDDSPLGMYYYHARFYSSVLGHFMSADSSGDGSNRFAYVLGNPLRYSDPSGKCAWDGVECDSADILRFMSCGLGGSCNTPEGVSQDDVRSLSRWALGQSKFWDNAFRIGLTSGNLAIRAVDIIAHAQLEGHDLSPLGNVAWAALGRMYSVPGPFFEASLQDLVDGGHRVQGLFGLDIIGARPWWEGIEFIAASASWKGAGARWDVRSVFSDFWSATERTANIIALPPHSEALNAQLWSPIQRTILHGESYAVDLTGHADPWDEIDSRLRDCVSHLGGDCFGMPLRPFVIPGG